jgi:hypothetical protein
MKLGGKMSEEMQELNPQIVDVEIGIRTLRKITIYPLSTTDQFKMSDLITKALQKFFLRGDTSTKSKDEDDMEFIAFLLGLIRKNIVKIFELICDEESPAGLLDDISNLQLSNIVKTIYEVNYEEPGKNVESLVDQVKKLFQSGRLLQQSVSDIPDIDLTTSSENHLEMEESLQDK